MNNDIIKELINDLERLTDDIKIREKSLEDDKIRGHNLEEAILTLEKELDKQNEKRISANYPFLTFDEMENRLDEALETNPKKIKKNKK